LPIEVPAAVADANPEGVLRTTTLAKAAER
jgi:hypothetical protein